MKLTESQLKELIYEEIATMVEEGEVDESILSGLGNLARKAGAGIKAAGKAIAKTYKTGSLSGDLGTGIRYMTRVMEKAKKNEDLVPEEQRAAYRKALSGLKGGLTQASQALNDLKGMEREQREE